jgi:hypothetical protein
MGSARGSKRPEHTPILRTGDSPPQGDKRQFVTPVDGVKQT